MASNSDPRKKEKRTAVDDGDSSPSSTFGLVAPALLSIGNIVHHFPEFLMHTLTYIADRTVFNSIASCNRDTHAKSKEILPPWPKHYQLSGSETYSIAVWSPDGTRVAYRCSSALGVTDVITIADQRYGIIHRINNNGVLVSKLMFSPNGRFLVSSFGNGTVKLWDNNDTGNYEQLQEWNTKEDFGEIGSYTFDIAISACSKYIAVARYRSNRVVLKSVENGETISTVTTQPDMNYIHSVFFSTDWRAVFVCGLKVIKLWRSYLDDTDRDSLINIWEQKNHEKYTKTILSHDKTMIAMEGMFGSKGWLLSIDNMYSCQLQELHFHRSMKPSLLGFTPDDECIIYTTNDRLKYWSVGEKKFTDKEYVFSNKRATNSLAVMNCSPNHRQLIVLDRNKEEDNLSIQSII